MRRWYFTLSLSVAALLVALLPALHARQTPHCRLPLDVARFPFAADAPAVAAGEAVILVVDTSGSMKDAPGRAQQLLAAISGAQDASADNIGLITYSDDARMLLTPGQPRERLDSLLGTLPTRGGSNPWSGLALALQWFRQHDRQGRIVWVSDGSLNSGVVNPAEFSAIAAQFRAQGIIIDVVEAARPDNTLMRDLAAQTGGSVIASAPAAAAGAR